MRRSLFLTIILILTPLIFSTFVFVGSAVSLEPGCYRGGGTADRPTYTKTNCPIEGAARAVSQFGACFVIISAQSVSERDCDDLSAPGSAVPESGSYNRSDGCVGICEDSPAINIGDKGCDTTEGEPLTKENCGIISLLIIGINFLSAIAGIVIVASIMIAGFQYMTAQDNAGQIEKAKSRIITTLLALVLLVFMYALLNFLVPGGVL